MNVGQAGPTSCLSYFHIVLRPFQFWIGFFWSCSRLECIFSGGPAPTPPPRRLTHGANGLLAFSGIFLPFFFSFFFPFVYLDKFGMVVRDPSLSHHPDLTVWGLFHFSFNVTLQF